MATMALPASVSVPRNATNGAILWDSGWKDYSSTNVYCNTADTVHGINAASIGEPVPGYTSNGVPSVFKTNVPGVGISVFWCYQYPATCNPEIPLPSLSIAFQALLHQVSSKWRVRLVKTGDIDASAGAVSVAGASIVATTDVIMAILTLTGTTQISGLGCEVNADSRNIDVRLPSIARTDFDSSPIPSSNDKAQAFNINLLCDSGVKISYQIDGAQAIGDGYVLANASGAGMATGVGVTLFKGGVGSNTPLPLATKFLHSSTSVSATPVSIPITARYYRTAASSAAIVPGLVSATATFTLFYE